MVKYLKERFNGNLFEIDEEKEDAEITDASLVVLHDFLTAKEEMRTGQLCLFPFYDFNIIPIELISNIYEILLGLSLIHIWNGKRVVPRMIHQPIMRRFKRIKRNIYPMKLSGR